MNNEDNTIELQENLNKERGIISDYISSLFNNKNDEKKEDDKQEEKKDEKKKGGGGGCSGGSNSEPASETPGKAEAESQAQSLGDVNIPDVDDSVNTMCKKTYTVHRAIPKDVSCPVTYRDNVSDQFTPQDDLITMEKTVRDFLKLEGKIYDPESTNPRFFAPEGWVQHYEKDKNTVLALLDQFRTNTLKMEHLYTVADDNSYAKLISIPNQDDLESYKTNVLWTSRALKDWANNWFIKRNSFSSTPLYDKDHWLPGLTGKMVQWMKTGSYNEYCGVRNISNETSIRRVDLLEAVIDRLITSATVQETISKFVNLKETLEQKADQKMESTFTAKIIDSQMGKKLGVTDTGTENHKIEGTVFIPPKTDSVEDYNLVCKLSCVKKLFQEMREKSIDSMKQMRSAGGGGGGPWPEIWTKIEELAEPVYRDLDIMNELIEDKYRDHENPGRHCSITHSKLCPVELKKRITSFKCIIQDGVIDVMTNQALLPKKGMNILDSMFNQMWEYSEKGPTIELPSWCQMAIDNINAFEDSMLDAWDEVFDCWEREFITRLWDIEVDHHTSNWERTQTRFVKTSHNHQHPFVPLTMMTLASIGGDTKNSDITPLKGVFTCPGHLEKLMNPVCIQYRVFNIAHLSRNYRTDVKSLCQWMCAAIEAVGIKQVTISAVMSDPSLNGECSNATNELSEINELREKNHNILKKVEHAYGIYSDVDNMKNKKEYDEEIALSELQPNKYSNEDQLNMTSSVQSEAKEDSLSAELCTGGIDITELKPWNHLDLQENKVEPKPIPSTCVCNKFEKIIKSLANFETAMNIEEENEEQNEENQEEEETPEMEEFDELEMENEESQEEEQQTDQPQEEKSWWQKVKDKVKSIL